MIGGYDELIRQKRRSAALMMYRAGRSGGGATGIVWTSSGDVGTYTPTRYVSAAGSDTNDGLTPATAWQTIAKVNAASLAASDIIAFRGGDVFAGTLVPPRDGASGTRLTFTSYGTGRAIINGGTGSAISGVNRSYVTIDGLNCYGNGTTNDVDGISFTNTQALDTKLPGILVRNCIVAGFGKNGITLEGQNGYSGFASPIIEYCTAYSNCFSNAHNATCGIRIVSDPGYGSSGCTTSPTIRYCSAYSNTGGSDTGNWSGSGIFIAQSTSPLIQYCRAWENGALCASAGGGPVGIWMFDSTGGVIEYCESYGQSSRGSDGGGFDIDAGSTNCTIRYCYSHGNKGPGFMFFSYQDDWITTGFSGNKVHDCLSINDGYGQTKDAGFFAGAYSPMTSCAVFNNVFYSNAPDCHPMTLEPNESLGITLTNNIFVNTNANGYIVYWPFGTASYSTPATIAGNCHYSPNGGRWQFNGTTYTSFASWQTASNREKIATVNVALVADPGLTSPGSVPSMSSGWDTATINGYKLTGGGAAKTAGVDITTNFSITRPSLDLFGGSVPSSAPFAMGAG